MNQKKLAAMKEGGGKLARIREELASTIQSGVTPLQIEALAEKLIDKSGGSASFKTVPGYHHATCINLNDGLVHGIPTDTPFKKGDLVSLDLGLLYKGFHTDTSTTVVVGEATADQQKFIDTGWQALDAAVKKAQVGNKVSHISQAIEKVITAAGYTPVKELTGHGIGKRLHQDPYIPNYFDPQNQDFDLKAGQALAIEPMYTQGAPDIKLLSDGWTITTVDGSLSALVEHTVFITPQGPQVLTQ